MRRAPPAPTSTRPRNSPPRRTRSSNAKEAVDQRDYRLALNHALDSRERAQNAAKMAADGKAAARTEADRAINAAQAAINAAQAPARRRLKPRQAARGARRDRDARSAAAQATLQEARADVREGRLPAMPATGEGRNRFAGSGLGRTRRRGRDADAPPALTPRRRYFSHPRRRVAGMSRPSGLKTRRHVPVATPRELRCLDAGSASGGSGRSHSPSHNTSAQPVR